MKTRLARRQKQHVLEDLVGKDGLDKVMIIVSNIPDDTPIDQTVYLDYFNRTGDEQQAIIEGSVAAVENILLDDDDVARLAEQFGYSVTELVDAATYGGDLDSKALLIAEQSGYTDDD